MHKQKRKRNLITKIIDQQSPETVDRAIMGVWLSFAWGCALFVVMLWVITLITW